MRTGTRIFDRNRNPARSALARVLSGSVLPGIDRRCVNAENDHLVRRKLGNDVVRTVRGLGYRAGTL